MLSAEEQYAAIRSDPRVSVGGRPLLFSVSDDSAVPGLTATNVSEALASVDTGDSPVQQQFAEEADINTIVRRFGVTQISAAATMGVFGDFTGIDDFASAVERVDGARARFMTLPAEVRDRFGNDPGQLIYAAQNLSEEEFGKLMDPPKADPAPVDAPPSP